MLFNSYIFWIFFLIVILLYRGLPHKWQNRMLLVASYVFYGSWDWRFLSLIAISTVVDYFTAIEIHRSTSTRRKKLFCLASISLNLGLLSVFKYYGFFAEEAVSLLQNFGYAAQLPSLQIVLPVGISFYTFQTMSYTIDVYRGQTKPTSDFLDFALYVCFFPQLVAGPIERSSRLLPQVTNPRKSQEGDFAEGLYLVLMGMFKKVVLADNMAVIVNSIFAQDPGDLSGPECLVGVYAFAFQIYGDFSGYSSIARGLSKWMGFDLMVNFRMPYLAISPSDFWRRWHISLSTWLRDYLYIPLGGNRGKNWKTYRNLMVTMLLGGLWHGAGWPFIAWGLFHGLILCLFRPFENRRAKHQDSPRKMSHVEHAVKVALMFHLVCFGWLMFRADTMTQVWQMTGRMVTDFSGSNLAAYSIGLILFLAGPIMVLEYWLNRKDDLMRIVKVSWPVRAGLYSYICLMLIVIQPMVHSEFIYFQF